MAFLYAGVAVWPQWQIANWNYSLAIMLFVPLAQFLKLSVQSLYAELKGQPINEWTFVEGAMFIMPEDFISFRPNEVCYWILFMKFLRKTGHYSLLKNFTLELLCRFGQLWYQNRILLRTRKYGWQKECKIQELKDVSSF